MPRKSKKVPSYCLHKHSGQAVVRIHGKDRYLGEYGSRESYEQYERILADWRTGRVEDQTNSDLSCPLDLSINEMLIRYSEFAKSYYVSGGKPTKELTSMSEALWPVRQLFGTSKASEFGPKALKTVRQHMISHGLSRGVINNRVNRIKRAFKWAVAEELVLPSAYHSLQAVSGLRYGRTEARETEPVRPVLDLYIATLLPFMPPQVAAMVRIQRLTGMRPCEVVIMRPCDIDTSDDVWIYEPHDHKNRWRGHQKLVPLGPDAQQILAPFMDRSGSTYLFSPIEAELWRRTERDPKERKPRKTPVYQCEVRRLSKAKAARSKRKRKRPFRDHYDSNSYRRAIKYAAGRAKKAGFTIPHWFPYQLRHTRATEVRKAHGIEAAQVALGHARADVTEVYAEKNMEAAIRIAKEMG